ncbi:hypothetical protein BCR44DRAFT_47527 [Catenaria anguillulae PL171]|uniref:TLC domain-containing protein n=1 Tax=Catenaria anguillulae PL171 TaxID=765915 RepID=A0A1Y2HX90_9FUNG|nr:hypothetical protein BCR44DRAFT_47527 [Catenaria anguillulae PL171]
MSDSPFAAKATLARISATFISYSLAHGVLDFAWRHKLGPQRYNALSRRDRIYLAEKVCSSVNALVVSGLAFKAIFLDKAYDGDTMHPYPPLAHEAFSHLCGYTIYDLVTMWFQGGDHWSMWTHHLMSLYGTSLIIYLRNPSFYPLLFGVAEITALANNLVWYLQTLAPTSRIIPFALVARAVMFILTRVWIGPYAMFRAWANADFDLTKLWMQWAKDPQVAKIAAVLTMVNVFTIGWFNVGWTIATCKLAVRGWRKKGLLVAKKSQ